MKTYVLKTGNKYFSQDFGYTKYISKAKVFQRSIHWLEGYKAANEKIVEVIIKEK